MVVYTKETAGLKMDRLYPPLTDGELSELPESVVQQIDGSWNKGEPVSCHVFEEEPDGPVALKALRELFATKMKAILTSEKSSGDIFRLLSRLTYQALLTGIICRKQVPYKQGQSNYRDPSIREFIEELGDEELAEIYKRFRGMVEDYKRGELLRENESCDIGISVRELMDTIPGTKGEIKNAIMTGAIVPKDIFRKLRELSFLARARNSDKTKVGDLLSVDPAFGEKYEFLRLTYAETVSEQKLAEQRREEA